MSRPARLPLEPAPPRHGTYGHEHAKAQYALFDRLQNSNPETRAHLARVITGTCGAEQCNDPLISCSGVTFTRGDVAFPVK